MPLFSSVKNFSTAQLHIISGTLRGEGTRETQIKFFKVMSGSIVELGFVYACLIDTKNELYKGDRDIGVEISELY